jgi:hypothetical protein
MPKWMHERADHIQAKNPDMPKSEAFAIATQQMHSLGKSPKGYGTAEGRATAKKKYKTPEDDAKTAMLEGFLDELEKIASEKDSGFLSDLAAGAKKALTTPIPGTPEIMPGIAHAADKLKGLAASTSKQGPSKGFQAFQAARAAAGH